MSKTKTEDKKPNKYLEAIRDFFYPITHLFFIEKLFNPIKYVFQRGFYGYCDEDKYNLCDTIMKISLPIIKEYIKSADSYPSDVKSLNEWKKILKKIAEGFELELSNEYPRKLNYKVYHKKTMEARELFGKHWTGMWN